MTLEEPVIAKLFLDCSMGRLGQLASRIEECLERLTEEQVWLRGSDNENAAGNLILHLCGNVRQWIIAHIGGLPDVRQRDREFSARNGESKAELRDLLRRTLDEAMAVIGSLRAQQLSERHLIQGYDVSVLEAIYHVVEHFSMHTGQIIFITKALTHSDLGFYRHLDRGVAGPSRA